MLFYSKEVFNKLVYKHLFSIMGLEVLCKMKAKSNSFMGAIFSKKNRLRLRLFFFNFERQIIRTKSENIVKNILEDLKIKQILVYLRKINRNTNINIF